MSPRSPWPRRPRLPRTTWSSRWSAAVSSRSEQSDCNLDQLVTLLREARGRYINQGVVIRGDASLAYQDLADVLSACDEAGIRNVRLPVRSRDAGPKDQR